MSPLTRPLKKGDAVLMFNSWDRKGTISVTRFTVASAGKKQVHMLTADGKNGEFRTYVCLINASPWATQIVLEADVADVEAFALRMADLFLEHERAHLAACLERNAHDLPYCRAISKDLAALHEPRVIYR